MSNAEKPMGVCGWCMELAFAVVVPARSESLASGRAAPPKSRARSACCSIRSSLVRPRCGFARLEPQRAPARLYAACPAPTCRGEPAASLRSFARPSRGDPVPCAASARASLVGRAASSQCAQERGEPDRDQAVRGPRRLYDLSGGGDSVTRACGWILCTHH